MNEIKQQLGLKYFGTTDYQSALSVLAPSSIPVRRFWIEVEIYNKENNHDSKN
nr:MAG TPA: hypothetical protein [Caudoviricetes sp.]